MSRRTSRIAALLATAGVLATGGAALAGDRHDDDRHRHDARFAAALSGAEEVPAISTTATGTFHAALDLRDGQLHWRLSYDALESNATQAHIHFAQRDVNGGVSVLLCSNLPDAPRDAQRCPLRSGTLTGTAEADDVVGPADQGIAPGELDELAAAMGAGLTYTNVHSETFPNGEIRGQIAPFEH